MQHLKQQQQLQGREGGQLEAREEQLGTEKEERRGRCRTAAMRWLLQLDMRGGGGEAML
ncbi:hypothetical protein SORBI_3003G170333 [Sorghum bicolor]|uniref:Uncharacterized protein n=1 Tax=Sorghum bicolor TaxID=4558 RepID=A0A1W0VXN2_SORBI|nr:hypothetical protein SORBI_3003G170333 [Sorghum bicolor]